MNFPILSSSRIFLDTTLEYKPIQIYTPALLSYDDIYRREILEFFDRTIVELTLLWGKAPSRRKLWELIDLAFESLIYDWYVGEKLVKLRYREGLQIGRTTFNSLFSISSQEQLNSCHDRTIRWLHGGGILLRYLTLLDPVSR